MNKEPQLLLRDPTIEPTDAVIANCLGESMEVYTFFLEALQEQTISMMDWRFYNDGKTWLSKGEYKWVNKRGTHKTKPIFWLSIWDGFLECPFICLNKRKRHC